MAEEDEDYHQNDDQLGVSNSKHDSLSHKKRKWTYFRAAKASGHLNSAPLEPARITTLFIVSRWGAECQTLGRQARVSAAKKGRQSACLTITGWASEAGNGRRGP